MIDFSGSRKKKGDAKKMNCGREMGDSEERIDEEKKEMLGRAIIL